MSRFGLEPGKTPISSVYEEYLEYEAKIGDDGYPMVAIGVQSPARLFLHGVHLDSQVTPSDLFAKYITPYYQAFTEQLHQHGKVLSMHADNDSRLILKHLEEAGYDMQECFTTYPLVLCTLQEAR